MKSSTSNHTVSRSIFAGSITALFLGLAILSQQAPAPLSTEPAAPINPVLEIVDVEKVSVKASPESAVASPTLSFAEARSLRFDSHEFDLGSVIEWRARKDSTVEGILVFEELGPVYFEAERTQGSDWEIRESAILGEFVVLNESLPLNKWQSAGYIDSGYVEIVESNRLVTSVRFRASNLDDQLLAQSIIGASIDEGLFEMNTLVFPVAAPNDPNYAGSYTLNKLELEPVWDAYGFSPEAQLGRRPIIAVVDNGASDTSTDLHIWINEDEIPGNGKDDDGNGFVDDVSGWNFVYNSNDLSFAGGHGSTVSRIAASITNNGVGTASPASSASLMRVMYYETNAGSHYDVIDSMIYAVDNGADVVNCSFIATSSSMFSYVITEAAKVDCIIVAAAGNNKRDLSEYPLYPVCLTAPNLIGVGASDASDVRAASNFSSIYLDLFAPASVTSYSTPLVSSTVALLRAIKPEATAGEITSAIVAGVDVVPSLDGLCISNGRLNVSGAVEALLGEPLSNTDPQDPTPGLPSLNIASVSTNSIGLEWSVSGSVDAFELEVSESGVAFSALEPTSVLQGSERSVLVENLPQETSYKFRIRSLKGALASSWKESGIVTTLAPAPTAPEAPSISLDEVGVGSVSLSWNTSQSVDGFELQASEAGSPYASISGASSFGGSERSVSLTGLGEGVDYRFRIRAVLDGVTSNWKNSPLATTLISSPVAPSAPEIAISGVGVGTIDLSWSASESVDSFEVQMSEAGGAYVALSGGGVFASNETSVQLVGLGEGVDYRFRIRAERGGLTSTWKVSSLATTLVPAPVAPSAPEIAISGVGVGTIDLSWSASESVDSFAVQMSEAGGAYVALSGGGVFASNETSVQLVGLSEGVDYRFRIRAERGGLTSTWKVSALATTLVPAPVAPSVPEIAISGVGVGTIDLSWSASESVDSFEVQMSEAGGAYVALSGGGVFASNETSVQLVGLGEGVDYRFRIRAERSGLTSTWKVSSLATTLVSGPVDVEPPMPFINIESVGAGTVTLSWSVSEGVDAFDLEASVSGQKYAPLPGVSQFSGSATGVQLTGLGQGLSYRFRIRAVRGDLTSMWKKSKLATTTEASQGILVVPSISVDSVGIGTVDLSWNTSDTVDGFELQMSKSGAEFADVELTDPLTGTESGVQLLGLEEGVNYAFRIRSVKEGVSSDWGLSSTVKTLAPAPEAPASPTIAATLIETTTVNLSWSSSESVDGFELQISESGAAYEDLQAGLVLNQNDTSLLVQDLVESVEYQFRIRSVRNGLFSGWTESGLVFTESIPWPRAEHNWKFNNGAEPIAYDSGSMALDIELSAQSGTNWGDGVGALQTGLEFSGSHKGVEVPDSNAINLTNQKSLTLSLWVKIASNSSKKTSVVYEQGGFWRGLNLIVDEGWLFASGWNRPVKESDWAGTTLKGGELPVGQWSHIVLVLDAAETVQENGLTLYVNGQPVASGPASMLWANMEKTGIGQVQGGTVYRSREVRRLDPFSGSIDDLNIWCCALTPEEINNLYESVSAN
ncbi:S8 family serine peptidase [Puniceicoccales bacterium CK1056]|uniref:S8 family serine peptidase n=1 Tax=Oceanipulchritudo coccoides TaxID=2706888 RepID=A0A6B2M3E7_9BACT|nr:fibronectin type III domain-containing protein [Oceanipulchritudo coccoides]NDV62335.1 S8 family serine peptidase [Oceanipulchritudo coccoides]